MALPKLRAVEGGTPVTLQLQTMQQSIDIPQRTQLINRRFRKLFKLRAGERVFHLERVYLKSIALYFRVTHIPSNASPFIVVETDNVVEKDKGIHLENVGTRKPVFMETEPLLSLDINNQMTMTFAQQESTLDVDSIAFNVAAKNQQHLQGVSCLTWSEVIKIFHTNLGIVCNKSQEKDLTFIVTGEYWSPVIERLADLIARD